MQIKRRVDRSQTFTSSVSSTVIWWACHPTCGLGATFTGAGSGATGLRTTCIWGIWTSLPGWGILYSKSSLLKIPPASPFIHYMRFRSCYARKPFLCLFVGSAVYDRLYSALPNNSLVKGIMKASPLAQTSCLGGFHSFLNQFASKMIGYSYTGMKCRCDVVLRVCNFVLRISNIRIMNKQFWLLCILASTCTGMSNNGKLTMLTRSRSDTRNLRMGRQQCGMWK